jgi:hypothetical protein
MALGDYCTMNLQCSVNKDYPYFNTRMDKKRSNNYRRLKAGLRYHKNEKLSHIQIGFRRGYNVDVRLVIQKLMTFAKRIFGKRFEFFRAEVWENADVTAKWRVHVHMIWNAPYIKQRLLVEKIEKYAGDSVNVYIRLVDDHRKAANYLMQYIVDKQEGKVYFTKSRGWLPEGYERAWKDIKRDFYQKVSTYPKSPLNSDKQVLQEMSLRDPEWRKAGLYGVIDSWIDEQRDKPISFVQLQMDANGELFYAK